MNFNKIASRIAEEYSKLPDHDIGYLENDVEMVKNGLIKNGPKVKDEDCYSNLVVMIDRSTKKEELKKDLLQAVTVSNVSKRPNPDVEKKVTELLDGIFETLSKDKKIFDI